MSPRKDDNLGNNKQEKAGTKTTSLSSSQHMQWNDSEPGSTSTSCIHSCMTVMGIYKKGKAPRAHKDLPPEQIMVRQRLHTRQLYPMDNNNNLVGDVEASKQQKIKKNNYDVAMFHPIQGLVVVMDDNKDDDDVAPLYHTDIDRHSDSNDDEKRVSYLSSLSLDYLSLQTSHTSHINQHLLSHTHTHTHTHAGL